jgi:hypothetical protein
MKYFLYRMQSTDVPPGGGDFRSWLHFYKWGRPEPVTFRKRAPHIAGLREGDVLFFVLDGFLIGDALVTAVRDDVYIEGAGAVQEIDIAEKGIWEYHRSWGLWDKYLDRLRLMGREDEVPGELAAGWLAAYRDCPFTPGARLKGKVAVYNPEERPPFFAIKKK